MFAALRLAECGYMPIVYERGRDVRRRHRDVLQRFFRDRQFDPTSNLLFGEGGAGTYSDGKLYTRIHDPLCRSVLETFYQHGAEPDILIDARPHIGSDRLPTICARIRRKIESLGGEVRFESRVNDLRISDGRLVALCVNDQWVNTGPTILAIGHSARDTIRLLAQRGVRIDTKPFQIGIRIEHPQSLVDRWQYGDSAGHARLAPAEYHLAVRHGEYHTPQGRRPPQECCSPQESRSLQECRPPQARTLPANASCPPQVMFSFCMCPGGMILPTNESPGMIATNAASRSQRSGPFASSGLVITLDPATMGLTALEALAYLERWERLAFSATADSYRVPAQRATDYLRGRASNGRLDTSYPFGGAWTDIRSLIPQSVAEALVYSLPMIEAKFPGFAGSEAIITAPETRASSPVRIVRQRAAGGCTDIREAVGTAGLYPVGEGAGYAGGIVSAAVDGIKTAHTIISRYAPP